MKKFEFKQNISGAFAPGRGLSSAPWNIFSNTSFNSNEVHNVKSEQNVHSLLPECSANAPTVLSTVYTDSTPAKNRQADVPQYGRSMIEMLGVLAIIGVLSVGGIAGYSKAMQKYRINKTIEQITLIAGNVRTFFAPQRSYEGLSGCYNDNDYCKLIKKAKLMPDEMWDDTDKQFNNVFGYRVELQNAHKSSNTDNQAFRIRYAVPADYELCIELASYEWSTAGVKGMYFLIAQYHKPMAIPATLDDVVTACTYIVDKAINSIKTSIFSMYLYFDVNSNCWNTTKNEPNTCS